MVKKILPSLEEWMKKHFKRFQRPLTGLAILVALLTTLFLIWQIPEFIIKELPSESKGLLEAKNELRKTLIQIIGGIIILYGLYLTYRRTKILEEGHITERFTKAVEQLGSEKLEIRLGGIYALERIAKDSEKDHWTVMEVLSAFVRENSMVIEKPDQEQQNNKEIENSVEKDNLSHEQDKTKKNLETKINTDIQAILTVIGRRKWIENEPEYINLSFTNLQNANLWKANLQNANFQGANLQEAQLYEANLQNTYLHKANLQNAILQRANLREAFLEEANLENAILQRANLQEAQLYEANLQKAFLIGANIQEAFLQAANLQEADLQRANLQETDLEEAKALTLEQLSKVKTLYKASLNSNLLEQVKNKYPHLLEKP